MSEVIRGYPAFSHLCNWVFPVSLSSRNQNIITLLAGESYQLTLVDNHVCETPDAIRAKTIQ